MNDLFGNEITSVYLLDAGPVNCMLDFETWGTRPGDGLRSIGAVMFDPHGSGCGAEFYMNIADDGRFTKMASTVDWWATQPKEVEAMLLVDQKPIAEVADAFHSWWRKQRAIFVWGQGASFDPVMWEAAMRVIGASAPWKFWDIRCTRTAYDMGEFNYKKVVRDPNGPAHHALYDAKHQVACVQGAYANVEKRR